MTTCLTPAHYTRFLPLVRRVAMRMARRLPRHIELDELLSQGWLGVVEAASRAPASLPAEELEAFVSCRVKGAMLDYLRAISPNAREQRNADRRATRGSTEAVAATFETVDFDSVVVTSDATGPEELVGQAMERARLAAAIGSLPTRDQQMLSLHFEGDCTLKEIGLVFGVTESRVSQILSLTVRRLRAQVADAIAA